MNAIRDTVQDLEDQHDRLRDQPEHPSTIPCFTNPYPDYILRDPSGQAGENKDLYQPTTSQTTEQVLPYRSRVAPFHFSYVLNKDSVEIYKQYSRRRRFSGSGLDDFFTIVCPRFNFVFSQAFSEMCFNDRIIASTSLASIITFMKLVASDPGIPVDKIGAAMETTDSRNRAYAKPSGVSFKIGEELMDYKMLKPILDKEIRRVSLEKGKRQLKEIENDTCLDEEVKAHKKSTAESFISLFRDAKTYNKSVERLWDEEESRPTDTDEEAAKLMQTSWKPRFAKEAIDATQLCCFIEAHKIELPQGKWKIEEEEFLSQVECPKNSSQAQTVYITSSTSPTPGAK